ncbi:helix-turn-helix domain-containing protein (plasmid) [Kozakia baliensis]|uniref:helix-turn-helix domain-containing protein n=1 Tax=Kozakia baliensis TaxID=153496 RepID=UPI00345C0BE7
MARMTLSEIGKRQGRVDWARVQATTDDEIDRHAKEDGTDTDLPGIAYPSPGTLRRRMGLTQSAMADLIDVPLATWRNWEQGRVSLDPAVRTLLRVLWREPDAVRRAMVA